jgi:hypothetical protein
MAIVAATSLGIGQVDRVRAEISSDFQPLSEGTDAAYRLIVQSYSAETLNGDTLPAYGARPLGSVQRSITAEELREGIAVDLLQLDGGSGARSPMVIAWVEPGEPDLEFDALRARPSGAAVVGTARAQERDAARVVLRRQA